MSMHKPFDRHFFVVGGNVMTAGQSFGLGKGQIGLFSAKNVTPNGHSAVNSLAGLPTSEKFYLKQGISGDTTVSRTISDKPMSSFPFSIDDVVGVSASAPEKTEQAVDEVLFGYDGINADSAIMFKKGDRKAVRLRLSGEAIGMLGYAENFVDIEYVMEEEPCNPLDKCNDCDDCEDVDCARIIKKAVDHFRDFPLRGFGFKVSDIVEVTPILSCEDGPEHSTSEYQFFTLNVCDMGDDNALGLVQAQYPNFRVVKTDRRGSTSTYQILAPQGTSLADYEQAIASILKGCEDCPEGWDTEGGGFLYTITLPDGGEDLSSAIEAELPEGKLGDNNVEKQGSYSGVGFYTVVLSAPLTSAETNDLIAEFPDITVELFGPISEFCTNDTVSEISWVAGDTCEVSSQEYTITIPDDKCGESRLSELNAAFPKHTITVNMVESGNLINTVTLTGTSGTADISFNGEDFTATFDSDLSTTAANFITTHQAALEALGISVENDDEELTFVYPNTLEITVANTDGNLDGGVGEAEVEMVEDRQNCSTRYTTTVVTNLVCDQCSDIFKDYFRSETPANFDTYAWKKVEFTPEYDGCLCGIRFKGKEIISYPDEYTRDTFGFMENSTKIEVSGGFITEVREGIGLITDNTIPTYYVSRWAPRTHVGERLIQWERESFMYHTGHQVHEDVDARFLLGEFSNIVPSAQYVDYVITIRNTSYAQSFSQRSEYTVNYHIMVELGKHTSVQNLVNMIAAKRGLPTVSI